MLSNYKILQYFQVCSLHCTIPQYENTSSCVSRLHFTQNKESKQQLAQLPTQNTVGKHCLSTFFSFLQQLRINLNFQLSNALILRRPNICSIAPRLGTGNHNWSAIVFENQARMFVGISGKNVTGIHQHLWFSLKSQSLIRWICRLVITTGGSGRCYHAVTITVLPSLSSPESRESKVSGSRVEAAHPSLASRTASTLWTNDLKVGRCPGSLLQHSIIILRIWGKRRQHHHIKKLSERCF